MFTFDESYFWIKYKCSILVFKQIAISSFIASCTMFSLFYVWHGIILNDFLNLRLPVPFFLTLLGIVYFVSGLAISVAIRIIQPSSDFIILKAFAIGGIYGFFLYTVAVLYGMSFSNSLKIEHLLVDYLWQIFEQGFGGIIIGFSYQISLRREKLKSDF